MSGGEGPEERSPTAAEREEASEGGDGAPETVPDAYEQARRTGGWDDGDPAV